MENPRAKSLWKAQKRPSRGFGTRISSLLPALHDHQRDILRRRFFSKKVMQSSKDPAFHGPGAQPGRLFQSSIQAFQAEGVPPGSVRSDYAAGVEQQHIPRFDLYSLVVISGMKIKA